jgi:unsaturated rhamnogalacturonyl hydrolase
MRRLKVNNVLCPSRAIGVSLACVLATLVFGLLSSIASSQQKSTRDQAPAGDSVATPLPIAKDLSSQLRRSDIAHAMQRVADWQLQRANAVFNRDWTFAALYTGFMAVPEAAGGLKYQNAMLDMARKFQFQPGPRLADADDLAVSQTYLDLYFRSHDPAMIAPTRTRVDAIMQLPDDPKQPLWWWCDALFMAPSVLAKLSRATGDRKYLDFMDHEWWITSNLLYSPTNHLYFRDKSFLNSHEANGRGLFWSRGNGWVFAGLARVLSEMPADYPSRARYVAQFREMAQAIVVLQGSDGLWRPGLLDAASYPLPENSGSAFFAFGFAYGIKAGILDRDTYLPVVEKAWSGLLSHVYEDGRLGCVQPVGATPGAYTETTSYVYGTGAFLLVGSELYRMPR